MDDLIFNSDKSDFRARKVQQKETEIISPQIMMFQGQIDQSHPRNASKRSQGRLRGPLSYKKPPQEKPAYRPAFSNTNTYLNFNSDLHYESKPPMPSKTMMNTAVRFPQTPQSKKSMSQLDLNRGSVETLLNKGIHTPSQFFLRKQGP